MSKWTASKRKTPSWAEDKLEQFERGEVGLDEMLVAWVNYTIVSQRGLAFRDIAKHEGVSHTLTQNEMKNPPLGDPERYLRYDEAVTKATEEKHHKVHPDCQDVSCGVYIASGVDERGTKIRLAALDEEGRTTWKTAE